MFVSFQDHVPFVSKENAEVEDFFNGVIDSNMFPISITPGAQKKPQNGPFLKDPGHFEHHRKPLVNQGARGATSDHIAGNHLPPCDFTARTTILWCKAPHLPRGDPGI